MAKTVAVVFTGTRVGMSVLQQKLVRLWLSELKPTYAVHGGCVGADWQFHQELMLLRQGGADITISVFPSTLPSTWAAKPNDGESIEAAWLRLGANAVAEPEAALARNRGMVRVVEELTHGGRGHGFLIATPRELRGEIQRSGTWATIRSARVNGELARIIVRPQGTFAVERTMVNYPTVALTERLQREAGLIRERRAKRSGL